MLLLSSHWDIYEEESTNPQNLNVENKIESNIPTNVHCAKERHILLFNKYKSIFSRTVNPEPAAVPPMTLQVDTSKWESRQHRLAPRYQSTIKHEEIKKTNEDHGGSQSHTTFSGYRMESSNYCTETKRQMEVLYRL